MDPKQKHLNSDCGITIDNTFFGKSEYICQIFDTMLRNQKSNAEQTTDDESINNPNCGVMKTLYLKIKDIDKKTSFELIQSGNVDDHEDHDADNTVVEDLLLGYFYEILPLSAKLSIII